MRLGWLTDIHLNFLDGDDRRRFWGGVRDQVDAVAISGDIGESQNVAGYLREWDEALQKPAYFVLGNHDFYRGSIQETRRRITDICSQSEYSTPISAGPNSMTISRVQL